jgi:hypothetical protein
MSWWEQTKKRRRRSVYEPPQRSATSTGPPPDVVLYDDIPEDSWVPIGELNPRDPFAQPPDYSRRARGWRPWSEVLLERWRRGG